MFWNNNMKNNRILKNMFVMGGIASSAMGMAQHCPNVLVIMTDEHNFRTLGCYREQLPQEQAYPWGKEVEVKTPHIDALASRGALCLNYYATHPVSGPSRGCFMTGMYPQKNGVTANNLSLRDEVVTFAETLADNGYTTAYFGKWHLDGGDKPGWTPKRKFGFMDNRYMYNRGHWKKLSDEGGQPAVAAINKEGKLSENLLAGADENSFSTDFLANRALRFIEENKGKPFCCFLSIADPHGPNVVRAPYSTMYTEMKVGRPASASANVEGMPAWAKKSKRTIVDAGPQNGMAQYLGMVKCIDDNVGKVMRRLQELGLNENTIVIFTADHGDLLGEHGRDNKSVPFEASAKIPFIWTYPGKIPAGSLVKEAMNNTDFTPTLLKIMNIQSKVQYQGKEHSKAILGEKDDTGSITAFKGSNWIASTDGRYKLIYSTGLGEVPVLFDLLEDPNELVNIYHKKSSRKIIERLATYLRDYCTTCEEPMWQNEKIREELSLYFNE